MLDVHAAQLTTDDLHRVGDTLRLHFALGALLPFDLDLGILSLQFLRRRQLARDCISDLRGVLNVADDDALERERAAGGIRADSREHVVADRDQGILHFKTVALLHLVAREGPQWFAHEVAVGHLDDRVGSFSCCALT